ncbi:cysteine--tRNA ligase [Litorimonas sp.]|uniref:cysteine--tRNA ligase n=1 Tax=Litorimonas sp. TaxID=1892381 RepID=UPI003A87200A
MTTAEHPLTLYNSLTREKERFIPQNPKRVTMYNCGPTVYSYAHIGNARAAVVADVLFRVLRHIYGEDQVVYARNITDVDDKIIAAAKELSEKEKRDVPISEITEKYARIYNEDLAAIGCLAPTHQPKATDHISHMIEMIEDLIEKDFAYESDGHVFFDVSKYDDYGKLSGNTLDALRGGDRVGEGEVARKRNAADFVLWKPELDGVGWDAPFGPDKSNMKGRPGWHIECSAMAKATLCDEDYGNTIDIHCGGVDLKFPHHENEKAQSCCSNGTEKFANFWVHNEFLNMGSEKMSKSLGNVTHIRDLLKEWDGEVIRLALLKAHYRSELQWSEESLNSLKTLLRKAYRAFMLCNSIFMDFSSDYHSKDFFIEKENYWDFLMDDGYTWHAISFAISDLTEVAFILEQLGFPNRPIDEIRNSVELNEQMIELYGTYSQSVYLLNSLGFLNNDPEEWFRGKTSDDEEDEINDLIQQRDAAKTAAMAAKKTGDKALMGEQFKRSDEIRDKLKAKGIILEDGPDGTTWRRE